MIDFICKNAFFQYSINWFFPRENSMEKWLIKMLSFTSLCPWLLEKNVNPLKKRKLLIFYHSGINWFFFNAFKNWKLSRQQKKTKKKLYSRHKFFRKIILIDLLLLFSSAFPHNFPLVFSHVDNKKKIFLLEKIPIK